MLGMYVLHCHCYLYKPLKKIQSKMFSLTRISENIVLRTIPFNATSTILTIQDNKLYHKRKTRKTVSKAQLVIPLLPSPETIYVGYPTSDLNIQTEKKIGDAQWHHVIKNR